MAAKVSVIIPIHNSVSWLRRCLDSICGQTLKDIQIICVDDGSTDGTPAILQEYARRDDRVLLVRLSPNQGEGIARNVGMALANAPWVGFVDSDDTIDSGFFGALHAEAESGDADMVCGPIKCVDERNVKRDLPHWTWVWSSLFRTDFLRKHAITFLPKASIGTDTVFMVRVLLAQPVRHKIQEVYYNYYQIPTSASHHPSDERCQSCMSAFRQIFSEVEQAVRAGAITAEYAQPLVHDSFQVFLKFIIHRFTDTAKCQASAMLVDLFARYPHLDATRTALKTSDPKLLGLLESGNADKLADYLLTGRQRFAAGLRERLKKRQD